MSPNNLISLLLIAGVIGSCTQSSKRGISKEKALQICASQLAELGLDTLKMDLRIDTDPLTMDKLREKGVISKLSPAAWSKGELKIMKMLDGKPFWECGGKIRNAVGGVCLVYIDSLTGKVLYVYDNDANAPKKWYTPN